MSARVTAAVLLALLVGTGAARGQIVAPRSADPGSVVAIALETPLDAPAVLALSVLAGTGAEVRLGSVPLEAGATQALIDAPRSPGSYVLRLLRDGQLLSQAEFEVTAQPVVLTVPERAPPGGTLEVAWQGSGGPGDLLRVTDIAGTLVSETPLGATSGATAGTVAVPVPARGGEYLLAYVDAASGTVLEDRPFIVEADRAWIRAPAVVRSGTGFDVAVHGPVGPEHVVEILDVQGRIVSTSPTAGATGAPPTLRLTAPRPQGRYRLRYLNTVTRDVLSDVPMVVN